MGSKQSTDETTNLQDMIKLMITRSRGGVSQKGLRIDVRVNIPGYPELWIDHRNTHITKLNNFKSTYDFSPGFLPSISPLRCTRPGYKVVANINGPGTLDNSNDCFHQSTPGVEQMFKSKNSTYEPLITLVNIMNKRG
jgi:hypothetical protein